MTDQPQPGKEPASEGTQPWLLFGVLSVLAPISVLLAVSVTAATMLARWNWFADLLANLRFQVMIAVAASLVLAGLTQRKSLILPALGCLLIHGAIVARAYRASEQAVPGRPAFSVMTLNVLTSNRDTKGIVRCIETADADVVALLEICEWQRDQIMPQLREEYPFGVFELDAGGNFGIGLISRSPLEDVQVFQATPGIDSIQASCNGMSIIATHPLPPMSSVGFRSRNEHLQAVEQRAAGLRKGAPETPVIVMGDLNVTPWSPCLADFGSRSGLKRACQGWAITPTWYAGRNQFIRGLVLDHVFASDDLRCIRHRVSEFCGSDHRGVTVQFQQAE
ncbi:MAG: endonuclease/exonuclease/phosphatase family protein [Planctomycetota bacterium]